MKKQIENIEAQIKLLKKISRAAGTLGLSQLEIDLKNVATVLTTDITIISDNLSVKVKTDLEEKLFICDHADECTKADGCPSMSPHRSRFCCNLDGSVCNHVGEDVRCIPYKG